MYKFLYLLSCYIIAVIGIFALTYIGSYISVVSLVILSTTFGAFFAAHVAPWLANFFVNREIEKDQT